MTAGISQRDKPVNRRGYLWILWPPTDRHWLTGPILSLHFSPASRSTAGLTAEHGGGLLEQLPSPYPFLWKMWGNREACVCDTWLTIPSHPSKICLQIYSNSHGILGALWQKAQLCMKGDDERKTDTPEICANHFLCVFTASYRP